MNNKTIKKIWESFKETEASDFKNYMGYGVREIKHAGVKKFITAMGWTKQDDVKLWRTDRAHLIICGDCKKEFVIYEHSYGLCDKCEKQYNMDTVKEIAREKGMVSIVKTYFSQYKSFREFYKKGSKKENLRRVIELCPCDISIADTVETYLKCDGLEKIDDVIEIFTNKKLKVNKREKEFLNTIGDDLIANKENIVSIDDVVVLILNHCKANNICN